MIKFKVHTEQWSVEFLMENDAVEYQSIHGGTITPVEEDVVETPIKIVPNEVSLWRIRAKLRLLGFEEQANQAISRLQEPQRTISLSAWEYAYVIDRWSSTVAFLQNELELTSDEVDQIFIEANEMTI